MKVRIKPTKTLNPSLCKAFARRQHKTQTSCFPQRWRGVEHSLTCDSGREGASWDVLVIIFDQDAVVPWQDRKVGHCACPILVVHAADVRFGWALDSQRKTTCINTENKGFLILLTLCSPPSLFSIFP